LDGINTHEQQKELQKKMLNPSLFIAMTHKKLAEIRKKS
jgi:hypothetical protein